MVEHAQRTNRDAVFQVLVDRVGADGLANGHAVLLVTQIIPVHAGNAVDDLAHRLGLVGVPLSTADRTNGHRGFGQFGF